LRSGFIIQRFYYLRVSFFSLLISLFRLISQNKARRQFYGFFCWLSLSSTARLGILVTCFSSGRVTADDLRLDCIGGNRHLKPTKSFIIVALPISA